MFVLSDSKANRAYGTVRGFQLRASKAALSVVAWASVNLQVWMVGGFTAKNHNHKDREDTKVLQPDQPSMNGMTKVLAYGHQ